MKLNAFNLGVPKLWLPPKLLLIMKLTIFILITSLAHVFASSFGQNVNLEQKNVPLKVVLNAIEAQTGYVFLSRDYDLNKPKVSVTLKNSNIEDAIKTVLKGLHVNYKIVDNNIILSKKEATLLDKISSYLATVEINGKVVDEKGIPLPGASVNVKGTKITATTDKDGRYSIKLPEGNLTLVYSYIGFISQEIKVGDGDKVLNVTLKESDQSLDELVILGFGQTQKKVAQTGSSVSIGLKELKQSPTANITNALAGRLPGLTAIQISGEPGNDKSQLLIRGRATMNGQEPLITIDGVKKDYSAIALLDVNEIDNITILKDASATALYGVKGANGVIIVTTRRGKQGKPEVSASVQRAVQTSIRLPEYLDSYNYAVLANEAYLNDHPGGTAPYNAAALEGYRSGSDPYKYPNVDWLDEMMKPAMQTQANFNIGGGGQQSRYFVNVGYTDQGGIYKTEKDPKYDPTSSFKRYNFRSNIDIDFDDNFSMALNLFGAIENKRDPNVSVADLFWTLNQVPPNAFPVKYPTGSYGERLFLNPARLLNQTGFRESFNSSLSGMLSLTRKLNFITPGLTLKGNYSFDGYFQNDFKRSKSVMTAEYKGSGDYNDPANYTYRGNDVPLSAPSSAYNQKRDVWMDVSLNYAKQYKDHGFTGLLLINRAQEVRGNQVPFVSQGIVSRLTYNYKSKYFAEFNAGYNGTDNFSKDKRYGFFPAFSAGWVASEESFLKGNSVIDFLKIRGSYGLTGNDQIDGRRWLFSSEYIRSGSNGYLYGDQLVGVEGIYEGAMSNPAVTWETAKKGNIGVELKLLKDLFSVTADFFIEKRNDILILRSSVPSMIGMTGKDLPPANMGKVDNKGFEVELSHRNRFNNGGYFLSGNFALAKNKIIFMDEERREFDYQYQTGHPLGQIFLLQADRFFRDEMDIRVSPAQYGKLIPGDVKYKDLNNDGVINDNDMGPMGRSNIPEITFGLSGGLNWKNFDISFLFQGAANSSRTLVGGMSWEFYEGGKVRTQHLDRWTPETASTATWPALHYGGNSNNHRMSSLYLEDNSYIRLKNLEIGYTFKNIQLTKKAHLSTFRIYGNGMNLYTWTKAQPMFDPEYWQPNTIGNVYPAQRIVNFGASLSF
ncbi:TonB dependent receptor [compost metagenome]